ncbi:MAG: acyl-CoA thiolase [Pseudomonadota bacterium]|jgi:acetyl-CoA acyltransferase
MNQRRIELNIRKDTEQPVFWGGMRTPFGLAQRGSLKDIRPDDLLCDLLRSHRDRFAAVWQGEYSPSEMIAGCAYPEGEQGYNVGRTAALGTGIDLPAATINRLCGSALDAAAMAAAGVVSGRGQSWLVAGVESMSRVPRRGANFSESAAIRESAPQTYVTMGETAENLARKYPRISRAAQEEFAAGSHAASYMAWETGFYNNHVTSVHGLARDESIRFPANLEKMATLKPAFIEGGVITAATSSPMSDGAAAALVTSERIARNLRAHSYLRIIDVAVAHVAPELMGLGPVPATRKILARNGIDIRDIRAVEMNEAFAVQVMACIEELGIDLQLVNTHGGALAIGHPLGASGLRLLMTLAERMNQNSEHGELGLATLCVGGGQGIAMLCQHVNHRN